MNNSTEEVEGTDVLESSSNIAASNRIPGESTDARISPTAAATATIGADTGCQAWPRRPSCGINLIIVDFTQDDPSYGDLRELAAAVSNDNNHTGAHIGHHTGSLFAPMLGALNSSISTGNGQPISCFYTSCPRTALMAVARRHIKFAHVLLLEREKESPIIGSPSSSTSTIAASCTAAVNGADKMAEGVDGCRLAEQLASLFPSIPSDRQRLLKPIVMRILLTKSSDVYEDTDNGGSATEDGEDDLLFDYQVKLSADLLLQEHRSQQQQQLEQQLQEREQVAADLVHEIHSVFLPQPPLQSTQAIMAGPSGESADGTATTGTATGTAIGTATGTATGMTTVMPTSPLSASTTLTTTMPPSPCPLCPPSLHQHHLHQHHHHHYQQHYHPLHYAQQHPASPPPHHHHHHQIQHQHIHHQLQQNYIRRSSSTRLSALLPPGSPLGTRRLGSDSVMMAAAAAAAASATSGTGSVYATSALAGAAVSCYQADVLYLEETRAASRDALRVDPPWLVALAPQTYIMPPPPPAKPNRLGSGETSAFNLVSAEREAELAIYINEWSFYAPSLGDGTDEGIRNELLTVIMLIFTRFDLLATLNIPPDTFLAFLHVLEANYHRDNPYHNFYHAVDVLQCCYYCMHTSLMLRQMFTALDIFGLFVAAIGHDVGHGGFTNAFLVEQEGPLAWLYNDRSVLENMHAATLFAILRSPRVNFAAAANWSRTQWRDFRATVLASILGTDMALHFEYVRQLGGPDGVFARTLTVLNSGGGEGTPLPPPEDRRLMAIALIKFADICNVIRPFAYAHRWGFHLVCEFFHQGDWEKALGHPSTPMTLRSVGDLAKGQQYFLNNVAAPLYRAVAEHFSEFYWVEEYIRANLEQWRCWRPESDELLLLAEYQELLLLQQQGHGQGHGHSHGHGHQSQGFGSGYRERHYSH